MLSRVAESLYWTGRYTERAEDTSRLLHAHYHALLDADPPNRAEAWRRLLQLLGCDELFREHYGSPRSVRDRVPALAPGDQRRWVSLDPTHDREQTDSYVRIAVGRDYAEVPPTRGVYKGGAHETLHVHVELRAA
jgi:uncharacterized alpha-E superfamily protein